MLDWGNAPQNALYTTFVLVVVGTFLFLIWWCFHENEKTENEQISWTCDAAVEHYFKEVYGELNGKKFVYEDLLALDFVYQSKLDKTNVKNLCKLQISQENGKNPLNNNVFYQNMSRGHDMKDAVYIYHEKRPLEGIPANTWIEVSHCADKVAVEHESEKGAWFYVTRGSNIYLNTGKTCVYKTHAEAVLSVLKKPCIIRRFECTPYFVEMFTVLEEQGFDTIQFTDHSDMACGNSERMNCAVEIVNVKTTGNKACPANIVYRSGINHQNDCTCVERCGGADCSFRCASCI